MHATLNHPDPAAQYGFYEGVPPKGLIAWLIDIAITAPIALPFMLPFLMTAFLIVPLFALPVIWALVGFFYRWPHWQTDRPHGACALWRLSFVNAVAAPSPAQPH